MLLRPLPPAAPRTPRLTPLSGKAVRNVPGALTGGRGLALALSPKALGAKSPPAGRLSLSAAALQLRKKSADFANADQPLCTQAMLERREQKRPIQFLIFRIHLFLLERVRS